MSRTDEQIRVECPNCGIGYSFESGSMVVNGIAVPDDAVPCNCGAMMKRDPLTLDWFDTPDDRWAYDPNSDTEGKPSIFLQWKGTDACYDFWCACGAHGHIDSMFANHVTCNDCGRQYELACYVPIREVRRVATASDPGRAGADSPPEGDG